MNKIPSYVLFSVILVFGAAALGGSAFFLASTWSRENTRIAGEIAQNRKNERSFREKQQQLSQINQKGVHYVEYKNAWEIRRSTFDAPTEVQAIMRAAASECGLSIPTDGDKIVEGPADKSFRCDWVAQGKSAASILRWIAEVESRIDLLKLSKMSWKIKNDGTLEVSCSYIARFN